MKNKFKSISIQTLLTVVIASVSLVAILLNSLVTYRLMNIFINNFSKGNLKPKNLNLMGKKVFEETFDNGQTLGEIINSEISKNMVFSLIFALLLALIVGAIVGRLLSKSLKATSIMAKSMQSGDNIHRPKTRINEIKDVNNTLEDFNSKLSLKATLRKSKIDQLTHETRTPLTIINTQLEAMQDGIINPTMDELEICKAQVSTLTDLISNMSEVIESDKVTDKPIISTFYLSDLINQIASGLKMQFDKKKLILNINQINQKIKVSTDRSLLSQSIMNILLNSYKYTLAGGKVTLDCQRKDNDLSIMITDTGLGINEADMNNIFKAYYRSNDVMDIKGLGLGLYIVKTNIESLSGTVEIESTVGKGTVVKISLPAVII